MSTMISRISDEEFDHLAVGEKVEETIGGHMFCIEVLRKSSARTVYSGVRSYGAVFCLTCGVICRHCTTSPRQAIREHLLEAAAGSQGYPTEAKARTVNADDCTGGTMRTTKNRRTVVSGYEIEATQESSCDPATVQIHKLGTEARSWLTPAEARLLAAAIVAAARVADGSAE